MYEVEWKTKKEKGKKERNEEKKEDRKEKKELVNWNHHFKKA